MTLSSTLDSTKATVRAALPPATFDAIAQSIVRRREAALDERARGAGIAFPIVVDAGNRFAESLGLVFALPEDLRPLYREIGIDLPAWSGDDSHRLPIPATYVLDGSGRIVFAHVDFTRRADPEAAVAALERLERVPSEGATP